MAIIKWYWYKVKIIEYIKCAQQLIESWYKVKY